MNWVSVKDRAPDVDRCLAVYKSKRRCIYNMRHDGWFLDTIYACRMDGDKFIIQSHGPELPATHWMPLPALPEE